MIELPEANVIARQMSQTLAGKIVEQGIRGNAPHKFAFYNRAAEQYEAILRGKTMGTSTDQGSHIFASVKPEHVLVLGGGGERIIFHEDGSTLPEKYQLLLHFRDDTYLTVTVQGWGAAYLFHETEVAAHPYVGKKGISPLTDQFNYEYFQGLFNELEDDDARSIKYFVISKPGIWGVGNGYLQDILFRAKIHPKRRANELSEAEKQALYKATKEVLNQAVQQGGRDTERDLHDRPGKYKRILDSKIVGRPCPSCGTAIQKIQFLGGASYFCPHCQVQQKASSSTGSEPRLKLESGSGSN